MLERIHLENVCVLHRLHTYGKCVQSILTKDVLTHVLFIDLANYIVLGVSFIAVPRTAALSHRKPASAGRRTVSAAVLGTAVKETHCIKKKGETIIVPFSSLCWSDLLSLLFKILV